MYVDQLDSADEALLEEELVPQPESKRYGLWVSTLFQSLTYVPVLLCVKS